MAHKCKNKDDLEDILRFVLDGCRKFFRESLGSKEVSQKTMDTFGPPFFMHAIMVLTFKKMYLRMDPGLSNEIASLEKFMLEARMRLTK